MPFDAHLVGILLERAKRILAKDVERDCKGALTEEEIEWLLAGKAPCHDRCREPLAEFTAPAVPPELG